MSTDTPVRPTSPQAQQLFGELSCNDYLKTVASRCHFNNSFRDSLNVSLFCFFYLFGAAHIHPKGPVKVRHTYSMTVSTAGKYAQEGYKHEHLIEKEPVI